MPWIVDLPVPVLYLATGAILFLGGLLKGVIGIGMPLITIPLLTYLMPVPTAIALMAAPVGLGNLVQIRQGTGARGVFGRFWPLLLPMVVGLALGTWLLSRSDPAVLPAILGTLLVLFAMLMSARPTFTVPERAHPYIAPPLGFSAGLMGGFSSFFGPPIVLYLMALRTPKDTFIPTMALVYFTGVIPLYGSLALYGILTLPVFLVSLASFLPTLAGMEVGRRIRDHVDQRLFERLILATLAILGLTLIYQGLTA